MSVCGRGRCGRERRLRSCSFAFRVDYQLIRYDIRCAAQNAYADSPNENAWTEVDPLNRSGRVPAAH
jgi:hypothetical protein